MTMVNSLIPEMIDLDHLHEFVRAELTRLLEFQAFQDQYLLSAMGEAEVPQFARSLLFVLLGRLAELRTLGQPSQHQLFLCPKIRPVPKLGPSARGPPFTL